MVDLLDIAKRPPITTTPTATVRELCAQMVAERVGAVAVVDGDKLVGIVSERDVVGRVVAAGRDPETTRVADVMTSELHTARAGMSTDDAVRVMHDRRFRHLPIVDAEGHVVGMLSIRHLLRVRADELNLRNVDLQNFIAADGPGG